MRSGLGCMALLVAVALSGCLSSDAPEAEPGPVGRIDGAVVDHLLRPWSEVQVHLVEADRWTTTTPLGGFTFLDVPVGFNTVEVDLEGIGTDRDLLVVDEGASAKVILQVYDTPPDEPYVAELAHRANVRIAEPGAPCEECRWAVRLHERPVAVVVQSVWDGFLLPDVESHVIMEVHDEDGNRLLAPIGAEVETHDAQGRSTLTAVIDGQTIRDSAGSLAISYRFDPDNPVPHPDFKMESFLFIHYGMTDAAAELLS